MFDVDDDVDDALDDGFEGGCLTVQGNSNDLESSEQMISIL